MKKTRSEEEELVADGDSDELDGDDLDGDDLDGNGDEPGVDELDELDELFWFLVL